MLLPICILLARRRSIMYASLAAGVVSSTAAIATALSAALSAATFRLLATALSAATFATLAALGFLLCRLANVMPGVVVSRSPVRSACLIRR
jgi:hypothetical protein